MTTNTFFWRVVAAVLVLAAPSLTFAQNGGFGAGYGPPLKVVPPPKQFASSEEHYKYLLEQAKGGTKKTIDTVSRWDGLWVTARVAGVDRRVGLDHVRDREPGGCFDLALQGGDDAARHGAVEAEG